MKAPPAPSHTTGMRRRLRLEWLILTLSLALLVLALSLPHRVPGVQPLNDLLYDLSMQIGARPAASPQIVLIAIDDASIERLGYWPWDRSVHAALLARLGSARAVGLDLILADPHAASPASDRLLAAAIRAHGRVALPSVLSPNGQDLIRPTAPFRRAAAAIGRIDAQPDRDGILRTIQLQRTAADGTVLAHFSLALARLAGWHFSPDQLPTQHPNDKAAIQFMAHSTPYPLYPYAAVLDGRVPESAFRDRIVLVGAWASGLGDRLPTAGGGDLMPGIEILANSLQNLRQNLWIRPLPKGAAALACVLPVLLLCLALRHLSPRGGLLSVLTGFVAVLLLDNLAMHGLGYWMPPAGILVTLLLAYPLWNWRVQETSLSHIDAELERLRVEPQPAAAQAFVPRSANSLPARAIRLHQAVSQLKKAEADRKETLGFISHDMRSPQNTILAVIALRRQAPAKWSEAETLARVEQQAKTTLKLVDDFVQLARAESAPLNRHPCALTDLLQDCCDRRWPQATQQGIHLLCHAELEDSMADIDAELMHRAIGNLLDNALHYCPAGGTITCRLTRDKAGWRIHVADTGPGIPSDQIPYLFTRFWRSPHHRDKSTGSGLGLAFVQTVAQRHGGQVRYADAPGGGACFTLGLPSTALFPPAALDYAGS